VQRLHAAAEELLPAKPALLRDAMTAEQRSRTAQHALSAEMELSMR